MRQDLFLRVTKIVFDYVGNIIDVVRTYRGCNGECEMEADDPVWWSLKGAAEKEKET